MKKPMAAMKGGAKMKAFEKSGKDIDPKGMKEGGKRDMALDKLQMRLKGKKL